MLITVGYTAADIKVLLSMFLGVGPVLESHDMHKFALIGISFHIEFTCPTKLQKRLFRVPLLQPMSGNIHRLVVPLQVRLAISDARQMEVGFETPIGNLEMIKDALKSACKD